ncbi:MAG TPA: hypothetical protein VIQ74_14750 [Gemmatimonadaceae bacterium]
MVLLEGTENYIARMVLAIGSTFRRLAVLVPDEAEPDLAGSSAARALDMSTTRLHVEGGGYAERRTGGLE